MRQLFLIAAVAASTLALTACQLSPAQQAAINTAVTDVGTIANGVATIECRKLTKKTAIGKKNCKTLAGDVISIGSASAQGLIGAPASGGG